MTTLLITGNSTLACGWCGKYLGNATQVTYLNGNQPVCDLCLMKANNMQITEEQKKDLYCNYEINTRWMINRQ